MTSIESSEMLHGPHDDEARDAAIAQAEAELAEVNARLSERLRRLHPELFDSDGQMIEAEYRRAIAERGGTGMLTGEEILRVDRERQRQAPATRLVDAS